MIQGKVDWYNFARGFGILSSVATDGALDKYFFHITKVAKSPEKIEQGQIAQFDISPIPPRPGSLPMAVNIVITAPVKIGGAA